MQLGIKGGWAMLMGIAGQDAKVYNTQGGKTVAKISINIGKYNEPAKWVGIDGWNDLANVMGLVRKGDRVVCIGTTYENTYTDKNNEQVKEKRMNAEVCFDMDMYGYIVSQVLAAGNQTGQAQGNVQSEPGELADEQDDELPF